MANTTPNLPPSVKGDIVQITNETHPWFSCLLIVDEPKSFGCHAYVSIPQRNDKQEISTAYNRLKREDYVTIGAAVIIGE